MEDVSPAQIYLTQMSARAPAILSTPGKFWLCLATSFATNSISPLKATKLRSVPTAISSQRQLPGISMWMRALSIGEIGRDIVLGLDLSPFRVPGFESLPVYSGQPETHLTQFLNSAALAKALNALQLTERESLHIYRNGILLYLQRDSKDEVMSSVEIACKLAEQFLAVEESLDLTALPAKFENLFELIPKWALSDDEKRSELLEEESLESLHTFVEIVSPYIPAIDTYLDSFVDEPPPEAAVTLGTLAEYCLEAQIRLRDTKEE